MKGRMMRILACVLAFAVMMSFSVSVQSDVATAKSKKSSAKTKKAKKAKKKSSSQAKNIKSVKVGNAGKKITIGKGKTLKLEASVELKSGVSATAALKKLTYSSSDTSVATVSSSGVIKGKSLGSVKITVASKVNAKKKATIKVKVAKKNQLVSKITLNKKKLELHIPEAEDAEDVDETEYDDDSDADVEDADEDEDEDESDADDEDDEEITYQLIAKVAPSNATIRKVKWSSSDKDVVTVDSDGLVTVVDAGTATVTVKAKDGSGKKAVCKITVIDDGDDSDGGDEQDEEEDEDEE